MLLFYVSCEVPKLVRCGAISFTGCISAIPLIPQRSPWLVVQAAGPPGLHYKPACCPVCRQPSTTWPCSSWPCWPWAGLLPAGVDPDGRAIWSWCGKKLNRDPINYERISNEISKQVQSLVKPLIDPTKQKRQWNCLFKWKMWWTRTKIRWLGSVF